jgi:hypothetical protein
VVIKTNRSDKTEIKKKFKNQRPPALLVVADSASEVRNRILSKYIGIIMIFGVMIFYKPQSHCSIISSGAEALPYGPEANWSETLISPLS